MTAIQNIARAAAIAAAATLAITASVGAMAAEPVKPPVAKPTRYCVISEVAGSRFTHTKCKTRDAWIKAEGFDPAK